MPSTPFFLTKQLSRYIIIRERHYRETNGSPYSLVTKRKQLTFGVAVAFFHFMFTFVLDPERNRQDKSGNRCHRSKGSQQEHNNYLIEPFCRFPMRTPPLMGVSDVTSVERRTAYRFW